MKIMCPNCEHEHYLVVVLECGEDTTTVCPKCLCLYLLLDLGVMVYDESKLCSECTWFLEGTRTAIGRYRRVVV
jgi:hypothetical protein